MKIAVLLVALALVLAPASASAQCAWVLWSGTLTEPIKWHPLNAYSSRAVCHESLDAMGRQVGGVYKCLPDTVDPRGPKGG